MANIDVPLNTGLYQSSSPVVANVDCNNCYVNIPQIENALSQANLFGTPGLEQELYTGTDANRGAHVKAGVPYHVNGDTLYRTERVIVDEEETFIIVGVGTITGSGRVSMADNGTQLMIIDPESGTGWIYNENAGTPFQEITDPDFTANGTPQYAVFIDSFFVVTTDSKKFIKSDANNGLSWNALDFGSAEKDPDDIVAPVTFRGELFISGTETIQSFNNIGGAAGAGFPYEASGVILPKGVFAPFSLIETNNAFMFIGGGVNESPAIWASTGADAIKISTTAIDAALQRFSDEEIAQAFAWTYAQSGAYFVGFSLPTRAFVYDTISQKWHERTSKVIDTKGFAQFIRWRVNSVVTAYDRLWVGDSQDGRIGVMDLDIFSEYDAEILRVFSTIPLSNQGDGFVISEVELTADPGTGALEEDPQIRLTWSDDGGKTFNNELSRGIGKLGEYTRRAVWHRLGRSPRYRLFKFEFSDKYKFSIARLQMRIRGLQRGR